MPRITSTTVAALVATLVFMAAASSSLAAQAPARQQPDPDGLSTQFTSSDWSTVRVAKDALESLQVQAIPVLVALLGRDE